MYNINDVSKPIHQECEGMEQQCPNLALIRNQRAEIARLRKLLGVVRVHIKHPELGGLSEEQRLAIEECFEDD